ncbi:MAG: Sec-independent protein translocase protein TatB [Gammaproteobacteria bacterium]|nr:Sec-independent protein translocase protein TatB [Gammaproteobacteria bacterium]
MFDIGFWELLILFGLGLVVLGPERLPRVAVQVGNWAGQARRMARSLTAQMRAELDLDQQIGGGSYRPNRPKPSTSYNRPGVDDLKPAASSQENSEAESESSRGSAGDPETEKSG